MRSSVQFVSHPSLMVNDIILVTKWLVHPGTIVLGSAPPSPSLPLAATSMYGVRLLHVITLV